MNRWAKIAIISFLVILLMLVRAFGTKLFYDPFIDYFKNDYLHNNIPGFGTLKLFFSLFLRYATNAIISLAIIYVAFLNKRLIRFSIRFYIIAFVVLSMVYYLLLRAQMNTYLFTFYVRRFLIHPVFVLILLPAFYYQKKLVQQSEQSD